LVEQVFNAGGAGVFELCGADFRNRSRCGDGLAGLDTAAGDADAVKFGGLLVLRQRGTGQYRDKGGGNGEG